MNIYRQIASNKWRSFFIVFCFVLFTTFFFYLIGRFYANSGFYLIIGLGFALISSFISYFYSDKIILYTVNAKKADKRQFFDLYTVTENLAIVSGLPMPKIYVINDLAPNAFATGRDPKHAVICVTTGLLDILDRTELEGVIAHELSHIKNYDILLASLVAVLVGSISLISDWLIRNFYYSRSDSRTDRRNPLMMIFFLLVLIITPIIATLIQLALSRRREFLADASGALLTRYPRGLARALEKISQVNIPLRTATNSTAHLFIHHPFKKSQTFSWLSNLFNTHPPIEERIKILYSM